MVGNDWWICVLTWVVLIRNIPFLCFTGSGDVLSKQNTHFCDQEVRSTWMWIQMKQSSWLIHYSFSFFFSSHACRDKLLLAVDPGCKHQVLMLILLQQASVCIMVVSNDGCYFLINSWVKRACSGHEGKTILTRKLYGWMIVFTLWPLYHWVMISQYLLDR